MYQVLIGRCLYILAFAAVALVLSNDDDYPFGEIEDKTPIYNYSILPRSCNEAMGRMRTGSRVYYIYIPNVQLKPFKVYCLEDTDFDRPWTVIQRRVSDEVPFTRGWFEYKTGFGNLYSNFWLGLNKIHALTKDPENPHELWIHLKTKHGLDARYSLFAVGDEYEQFVLKELGDFTDNAPDAMAGLEGVKFTTHDVHNDDQEENCALTRYGGWWYDGEDCTPCNLNGEYDEESEKGISWEDLKNINYVQMSIRPIKKREPASESEEDGRRREAKKPKEDKKDKDKKPREETKDETKDKVKDKAKDK